MTASSLAYGSDCSTGGDDIVKDTEVQSEENKDKVAREKRKRQKISKATHVEEVDQEQKSYNVHSDGDEHLELLEQGHLNERDLNFMKTKEEERDSIPVLGKELVKAS